jgi:hypothetical protein
MKKNKQPKFVDKSYKLLRGVAPLTYMLPTKHSRRFPLLHFDESTGVNRELRYARNQNSCFRDEQDKNVVLEPIIFEDGFLYVPKENQILQKFLHYHTLNGKTFTEINESKDAAAQVDALMVEADALVEAKKLSLEQLENVCRVLFNTDTSKVSTAEMKRDILVYAKNNPQDFLDVIKDPDLKLMGTVQRFFDNGLLGFRKSGKEVWFNTASNKTKLLNVPFGEEALDIVCQYMQSDDGVEVLEHLESLLD